MTHNTLVRPALMVVALAAFVACKSGSGTSTSTAPAPVTTTTTTTVTTTTAARPFTAAMVAEGDSIYHARGCKNCHGPTGTGAANGPSLKGPTFLHVDGTYDAFVHIITTGVPTSDIKDASHSVAMAPRGGRPTPLSDDQIKAVAAYVYTLSHP